MEKQIFKNTLAVFTKEEEVKSLNHDILANSSVLEIAHPFPGYYINNFITSESKPQPLLILLKKEVSLESFYRKIHNIKKYVDYKFEAALTDLTLNNKKYNAVRVFDLEAYDNIIDLQKCFINEGFILLKSIKVDTKAIINVQKFFDLELIDNVYSSTVNSNFIYFKAEKNVSWKSFEHITLKIKHNYSGNKFDAGLGVLFIDNDIQDVVRIYSKDLTAEEIVTLKAMFKKEIAEF